MKLLTLLWLFATRVVVAQEQPPVCAANCTIAAATQLNCTLTNVTCLCSNEFAGLVTPCVQTHCSVREALTATNITASTCHWPSSSGWRVLEIIPPICGVIGTIAIVIRVAGKYLSDIRLKVEDYCAMGSWLMLLAGFSIAIEMTEHGMGRNIWEIPQENIYYIFKLYYIDEMIYISSLCFAKIAILFFYLGLFPLRWFQIAAYTAITLTAMYNITFVFALVFQCVPVHGAWTAWDGTFRGKCIDLNLMWWLAAALNIAFDIAVMGLPFWPLWKLQMSMKKKIQVGLMFSVGFFVTIVSIIRLQSLVQFGNTTNPTYDDIPLGYWSTIEMSFAIVVSCMPGIRLFVLHFFPRLDSVQGSSGVNPSASARSNNAAHRGRFSSSRKKNSQTMDTEYILDNNSTYELLEVDGPLPKAFNPRPSRI